MRKIQSKLFEAITDDEWKEMENILFYEKEYEKGEIILHSGDVVNRIGIVINGSVNIERVDIEGRRSIISNVARLGIFGESYALSKAKLMVDAVASLDSDILFIDVDILEREREMSWAYKLRDAMLRVSAEKNIILSNRIFCTSAKTIREKVDTYLSFESIKNNSNDFFIPFDREELADYLSVDRTALSKELGRMKREGLIDFKKNHFILS